jgi:hypothetical protein
MSADGGMNPERERPWDEARIALGRVSELFCKRIEFPNQVEYKNALLDLSDYEAIPLQVREAIEGLSEDERRTVRNFINTLAQNHFFLEDRLGQDLKCWF